LFFDGKIIKKEKEHRQEEKGGKQGDGGGSSEENGIREGCTLRIDYRNLPITKYAQKAGSFGPAYHSL
jgi:hypothetical protein